MKTNTTEIAKAYYTALNKKDIPSIEKYVHPDIQLVSPLGKVSGKEDFMESIAFFSSFLLTINVHTILGSDDQAMSTYDVEFPAPIGLVPTAGLIIFKDGLIAKIEIFFDPRPFN